ncbi:hypothetical protein DV515_00000589, partial [Chloebia gouldiae]
FQQESKIQQIHVIFQGKPLIRALMSDSDRCHPMEREIMESCTGRGFMQQEAPTRWSFDPSSFIQSRQECPKPRDIIHDIQLKRTY